MIPDEIVEIREYEEYPLRFILQTDQVASNFVLQIGSQKLERKEENVFYFEEKERGRFGEIPVRIFYRNELVNTGSLFITVENLSEPRYRYLIRDLKHSLVTIESKNETYVRRTEIKPEPDFITLYDQHIKKIGDFLDNLKIYLNAVEQNPQRKIVKKYHLEHEDKVRRIDARTIRWKAIHGFQSYGQRLTYTNEESYDIYENQFIVYTLDRLRYYLSNLLDNFLHEINQKIQELSYRIRDSENHEEIGEEGVEERRKFKKKQLKKLRDTKEKLKEIKLKKETDYRAKIREYQQQLDWLQRRSILAQVKLRSNFILKPTLVLLRHPAYHAIYESYKQIEEDLQLDKRQRIKDLLARVPIERTSKLYEYWVFIQIYEELKQMGFRDVDNQSIDSILDEKTFRLKSGEYLDLIGDSQIYSDNCGNTLKVRLYYECHFSKFCPDVLIKFIRGDTQKVLILDAKYRKYDEKDCPSYEDDVQGTAYHKYKLLERRADNKQWVKVEDEEANYSVRNIIAASFIVHSDASRPPDYGSSGHGNEYGAIPLVPEESRSKLTNLKKLLRMFMRMHLRLFDICWLSDEHEMPEKAKRIRKLGGQYREHWEWKYCCPKCGNCWWVNHCGRWCQGDGVNVPKITFSEESDDFFEPDRKQKIGGKPLLKCSYCNQSYLHHKL